MLVAAFAAVTDPWNALTSFARSIEALLRSVLASDVIALRASVGAPAALVFASRAICEIAIFAASPAAIPPAWESGLVICCGPPATPPSACDCCAGAFTIAARSVIRFAPASAMPFDALTACSVTPVITLLRYASFASDFAIACFIHGSSPVSSVTGRPYHFLSEPWPTSYWSGLRFGFAAHDPIMSGVRVMPQPSGRPRGAFAGVVAGALLAFLRA